VCFVHHVGIRRTSHRICARRLPALSGSS
jgi:hypothetical protein